MDFNFANVKLRENGLTKKVKITGFDKPEVPGQILNKWQNILNIASDIIEVPASLIMKLESSEIRVFCKNKNLKKNPYIVGQSDLLGHGLYCETVAGNKQMLLVDDATKSEIWKENPDVKLNMISYLGMPICWDDEEIFGTICVLDSKKNCYRRKFIKLLSAFKECIEDDLKILVANKKLKDASMTDFLTGLLNRNGLSDILSSELEKYKRYRNVFTIVFLI